MSEVNEIIGRALVDAGLSVEDAILDGARSIETYEEISAAVVKALGEAGHTVAKVFTVNGKVFVLDKSDGRIYAVARNDAGPVCTVCGAAAGLACSRQDCGALIK